MTPEREQFFLEIHEISAKYIGQIDPDLMLETMLMELICVGAPFIGTSPPRDANDPTYKLVMEFIQETKERLAVMLQESRRIQIEQN